MMSRERIFNLADKIVAKTKEEKLRIADYSKFRRILISAFTEEARFLETLDKEARERITRMRKQVVEGTGEWKALYEKFFMEALQKRVRI